LKLKLILITVLALGSLAHAQGFLSNFSIGAGLQGIFPAATTTKGSANLSGFPNTQSTTDSVGIVADARYDFGHHSALDFSVTVNRNTEVFFNGETQNTDRVQTNNLEMIGSYIFRLPSNERVKPYALVGGGLVRFMPNNNYTTGLTPATDMKAAFAYGLGGDVKVNDRWAVRLQYRGLLRTDPDFKLTSAPFGTGLRAHVPEPSIMVVYHF
jgi:opacity protein-like surface antigen